MQNNLEIWKNIQGYEGLYQVSNLGRVKSLEKQRDNGKGIYFTKEKILKLNNDKNYLGVCLFKNNKRKPFKVHRLVAEAFIPNPDNLPQVNHKDENKQNNRADNLEWCTQKYNNNYNGRQIAINKRKQILVAQYDCNNKLIAIFDGINEASRQTGINASVICRKCKNVDYKNKDGFVWKYLKGEKI